MVIYLILNGASIPDTQPIISTPQAPRTAGIKNKAADNADFAGLLYFSLPVYLY
jgi:hypothetical protein